MAGYKRRRQRRFKRRRLRRRFGYGRRRFYRRHRYGLRARTRPETKWIDYDLAAAPFTPISDTTWAELSVPNSIAQGLDKGDRIGREITIKSIYIRGFLATGNYTAPAGPPPMTDWTFCRLVLASWNGAVNALNPCTTEGVTFRSIIKPSNFKNLRKKFYDKTIMFQKAQWHGTNEGFQTEFRKFKIYLRFKRGYRVKWITAASTVNLRRQITFSIISQVQNNMALPTIHEGQLSIKYFDN